MAIDRRPEQLRPLQPEGIMYDGRVRYPSMPDTTLPSLPQMEVRYSGFLGLSADPQDADHKRRMVEIRYMAQEIDYGEKTAVILEVAAIKAVSEGMLHAEEIVASLPRTSVAAAVTADIGSHAAARSPVRHSRLMETFDAEVMNLIHRR